MLVYAIKELEHLEPDEIDVESFTGVDDLLTAMMHKALDILNKHNYLNEYNKITVESDKPKGRLLIEESYRTGAIARGKLVHTKFEFNIDSLQNRIIKSAIAELMKNGTLGEYYRAINARTYESMTEIRDIKLSDVQFNKLDMTYIPVWYRPALAVSKLIQENLMGLDKSGYIRLYNLSNEDRLHYIFEEFVRNYYKEEYTQAKTTRPYYNHKGDVNKLDILMEKGNTAIIIDTKWYNSRNIQANRNANFREVMDYMILYLENLEITRGLMHDDLKEINLSGLVLYGRTDLNCSVLNTTRPRNLRHDIEYEITEHTIDLNTEFENIKRSLNSLADKYFLEKEE